MNSSAIPRQRPHHWRPQLLCTGALLGCLVTAGNTVAADADCLSMRGLGNYNYAKDGRSGVAAMAGDFRGGVYFRQIDDFVDVGNGRPEGRFEHMFVTENGSTIRTQDKSWGVAVPGTDYIAGGAAYTVVDATGEFEGYTGTFHSWGTFAPSKGQAILRYEGEICRTSS